MDEAFTKQIDARLAAGRQAAVVGLDPRLDALPGTLEPDAPPAQRIVAFYREALPRIAPLAVAVKPNIAFFEVFGAEGFAAWIETCRIARELGLPVIGDIKRGDIGSTAAAYARAHFEHADAVTLHPYLGSDSIEPFLAPCRESGRAVFVLVHTSNPSAGEFQERVTDGETLCEAVADAVDRWGRELVDSTGYSAVGAVVGATYPEQLVSLRARMPRAWFLIPGVGAQGGAVADLGPAFDDRGRGALVNQSRGIMQCFEPTDRDWLDRITAALEGFCAELREVCRER
ncbi:MAG: orotidine-5'-phosphate decarboxylase [Planctomycetes bacterium]|nr:orotidine-5'-phosphate decarboxylase [Planctomycetota bacterium]